VKKNIVLQLCCAIILCVSNAPAATYYISTTGSDSNTGSSDLPFATIAKAAALVAPGDTIWIRGGIYTLITTVKISHSGTAALPIVMRVFPGDARPVFDFSGMALASPNQGIVLSGSYWQIYGLRIKGAGDNGFQLNGGGNNLIEFCEFFENRDAGMQLKAGTHDNRIINCDSYYNADYVAGSTTSTGGNADGFSPKLDCGTGNYFYGCRSFLNSDDGWDGYLSSDSNILTTIENCWSWKNGYLKDGVTTNGSMNGNGFKTGGGTALRHNQVLKNCLSFNNKSKGFDQNHNVGSITILNCTSKSNGANNFDISEALATGKVLTVENCISYESNKVKLLSTAVTATNSWSAGMTVSAADFMSIDTTGMSGPRQADGSLPVLTFMHLAPGSKLIDAGTNIGLPFNNSAPDLGCFETPGVTAVTSLNTTAPNGFELLQNFPNPFNPSTTINFTVPGDGYTTLIVSDILGREVAMLFAGETHSGVVISKVFDGSRLASGVYLARLNHGSGTLVRKLLLSK
jgi:hypothetical protein